MPQRTRRTCLSCRRHTDECGPISWGGNCEECGRARMDENHEQMRSGQGPFAEHWERSLVMALVRRKTKRVNEATS